MSDEIQKTNGTWQGIPCSIKNVWGKNDKWEGHEFTADERTALFNNEIIEFEAISKTGNPYTAKGKLEKQKFTDNDGNEHEYVGFSLIKEDVERFSGVWNGKQVNVKRVWGKNDKWEGHRFTDEEIKALLDGQSVSFQAMSKSKGTWYTCEGKLADQEMNNSKFVGFKPNFGS